MLDSFSFLTARENKTVHFQHRNKTVRPIEDNYQRPNTTFLGRTNNSYLYKSIGEAEEELSTTFKAQMSSFVKNRIRKMTSRNKELVCLGEAILPAFNPQQTINSSSKPRNIRQMRICSLSRASPRKIEEVVGEPYLMNARQKLTRLVNKKKQDENRFQTLQLKVKEKQKEKIRIRRQKDSTFRNPEHVKNIEWDTEWRKEAAKQIIRYRKRLSVKHNKSAAISSVTIEW